MLSYVVRCTPSCGDSGCCVATDRCACKSGWRGATCDVPEPSAAVAGWRVDYNGSRSRPPRLNSETRLEETGTVSDPLLEGFVGVT